MNIITAHIYDLQKVLAERFPEGSIFDVTYNRHNDQLEIEGMNTDGEDIPAEEIKQELLSALRTEMQNQKGDTMWRALSVGLESLGAREEANQVMGEVELSERGRRTRKSRR